MKHRGSNASDRSRRLSQNDKCINNDNNGNDKFEVFEMKNESINESGNSGKPLSSSQMNNNDEIKTQKGRVTINPKEIKINKNNDITEKSILEEKGVSHNELKDSHNIEDNFESRETLSVIGIENTHRHRRGSIKTYSEISSSVNRDQRKSTALKYVNLYNISNVNM